MTRIGLVLGAGGVAGGAWHAGALAALAETTGWDPRSAAVVVGTSAGSISGSALRAGLSAEDQWRLAVGDALSAAGARVHGRITTGEAAVGRLRAPRGLPANPALVLAMASRTPRPGIALAGLLPEGAVSTTGIRQRIDELTGGTWPAEPLLVVAVDLASGARAVFRGTDDPADATPGEAVAASCAVPAFFSPVAIGDHRYVDGGVHSPTNADLLAVDGLDAVIVSAPMAGRWRSLRPHPQSISRTAARVALDREVGAIRRAGTPVLVLQPGPEDTPLMDGRSMDPGSRQPVARRARASVADHVAALAERDDPVLAALRR